MRREVRDQVIGRTANTLLVEVLTEAQRELSQVLASLKLTGKFEASINTPRRQRTEPKENNTHGRKLSASHIAAMAAGRRRAARKRIRDANAANAPKGKINRNG